MKEKKELKLELSLKEEMEERISDLQKEYILDDLKDLPPVKENDINISTTYIFDNGDGYEASIFVRNGLKSKINFDKLPLLIVDQNNNVLASKIFDMKDLGDIPPCSVRPCKVLFDKNCLLVDKIPKSKCKVVFSTNIKAINSVKVEYENLPENISPSYKKILENYLENLPIVEKGQVSMSVYSVKYNEEDKKIYVTIVIRNGTEKKIRIEKIPMTLFDDKNKKVTSTVFDTKGLEISESKASIYNFVFLSDNIYNIEEYNLQKLYVKFV